MAANLASWGYAVVSVDHIDKDPLRTVGGKVIDTSDDPNAASPDFDQITADRAKMMVSPRGMEGLQTPFERWFPVDSPRRAA